MALNFNLTCSTPLITCRTNKSERNLNKEKYLPTHYYITRQSPSYKEMGGKTDTIQKNGQLARF